MTNRFDYAQVLAILFAIHFNCVLETETGKSPEVGVVPLDPGGRVNNLRNILYVDRLSIGHAHWRNIYRMFGDVCDVISGQVEINKIKRQMYTLKVSKSTRERSNDPSL